MRYHVRPIVDRTPFGHGDYKNSLFTVTWSTAEDLLGRELDFLDAKNVAIELDVAEHSIRVDGTMRADAKVHTPAVRLAFESNQGPLIYATDTFVRPSWRREGMRPDWQHNLYAIAKGLEALRMVDRYEITSRGEQYVGFKALPAGRAMPASHMTTQAAYDLLATILGAVVLAGDLDDAALIKQARVIVHPDRQDGDRGLWDQVEQAAFVLGVLGVKA